MHYRLDTQYFLNTLRALEQELASAKGHRAAFAAQAGDVPGRGGGRADCRRADRFADAAKAWPAEDPSHDLPH